MRHAGLQCIEGAAGATTCAATPGLNALASGGKIPAARGGTARQGSESVRARNHRARDVCIIASGTFSIGVLHHVVPHSRTGLAQRVSVAVLSACSLCCRTLRSARRIGNRAACLYRLHPAFRDGLAGPQRLGQSDRRTVCPGDRQCGDGASSPIGSTVGGPNSRKPQRTWRRPTASCSAASSSYGARTGCPRSGNSLRASLTRSGIRWEAFEALCLCSMIPRPWKI